MNVHDNGWGDKLIERDGIIVATVPRIVEEKWPGIAQQMVSAAQQGAREANKELSDALKFGEAACLVACALEPISANIDGWKAAAARIRKEREKLEAIGRLEQKQEQT